MRAFRVLIFSFVCDIKASFFSYPAKDIVMLFLEHYQSTPDHRGNYLLDPFRFGLSERALETQLLQARREVSMPALIHLGAL